MSILVIFDLRNIDLQIFLHIQKLYRGNKVDDIIWYQINYFTISQFFDDFLPKKFLEGGAT